MGPQKFFSQTKPAVDSQAKLGEYIECPLSHLERCPQIIVPKERCSDMVIMISYRFLPDLRGSAKFESKL